MMTFPTEWEKINNCSKPPTSVYLYLKDQSIVHHPKLMNQLAAFQAGTPRWSYRIQSHFFSVARNTPDCKDIHVCLIPKYILV